MAFTLMLSPRWSNGFGVGGEPGAAGGTGLLLAMPAKERMVLTDELTGGALDSIEEIALQLSPYLEMMD